MDNHVHLHLKTTSLTSMITWLLRGYSYWHNRKYGYSDKLFRTPFKSYCKFSEEFQINSIIYILANPLTAGICSKPDQYEWSSYNQLFHMKCGLKQYLEIDKTFVYKIFKTKYDLDQAIMRYVASRKDGIHIYEPKFTQDAKESYPERLSNERLSNEKTISANPTEKNLLFQSRVRIPTYDVIKHLQVLLGNKKISELEKEELEIIISELRQTTGATLIQLSNIFGESVTYVRGVLPKVSHIEIYH